MLKSVEDITTTKKRLKIEVPADTIEKEIRESLEEMRRRTTIPGFRQGKAPLTLIERRFGKKVEEKVLDRMIPRVYLDALSAADITPIADPVVEETMDFKRNQPLSLTFTVEILPKIDNLQYEHIPVRDIAVTVEDADVEGVLRRSQEGRATYEPSEGPVDRNDLITFDYSLGAEGVEAKDQLFKVGGDLFPEDFSVQLIGKKKGDGFTVETTFPEGHLNEKLAGRHAAVEVVVKDIKKAKLPDIDDEFAKDLGFDTLSALREHIREEISRAKKAEIVKIQKAEIMKKLLDSHEFDIPESLLEHQVALLAQNERREGTSDREGKDLEELRARALRSVKGSMILSAVGNKEEISVSEEDLRNTLSSLAARVGVAPEALMKFYISRDGSLDGLKNSIFEEKVLDFILSKAVFEKGD